VTSAPRSRSITVVKQSACLKAPTSFYFVQATELNLYRVVGGPPSPEQATETRAQAILQSVFQESKVARTNVDAQVAACVSESNRDTAAAKTVARTEIEAVYSVGLN
jgi:hypothetical protein